MNIFIMIVMALLVSVSSGYAKYVGPIEIAALPIGDDEKQLLINNEGPLDESFFAINDNEVLVDNGRKINFYKNSIFVKSLEISFDDCDYVTSGTYFFDRGIIVQQNANRNNKKYPEGELYFRIYDFDGNLINEYISETRILDSYITPNGDYFVFKKSDGKYLKKDYNGNILRTYTKVPPELNCATGGGYGENCSIGIGVKYVEAEIDGKKMQLDFPYDKGELSIVKLNDVMLFLSYAGIFRVDDCGKILGEQHTPPDVAYSAGDADVFYHDRYSDTQLGKNGDIYVAHATPTTYSILKWTWVDSPDDPKGGPDAPRELVVAPAATGLNLSWTASSQDPGCVEGYEVERSSTSGGLFSNITTTSPGVVSYNDTTILPGNSAFYRVRAKSACGPSPYTAEVGGTRP